ncbi:MAG: EAL domain-containing protein [Micromonosporaceae bacterium]|nr:EAL domain-containing protein [Micromonosporaceae bacterium]
MTFQWSVHQLTEYLSEVSGQRDEAHAMAVAAERAAEALDAEAAVVVVAGQVRACVGFGLDGPPPALVRSPQTGRVLRAPGIGDLHPFVADLGRGVEGMLVVARLDEPLVAEEFQMLHGMAKMLGLAIRGLRILEAERILRETREREAQQRLELLEAVRARQRLVETLLEIQRAISGRRPLQEIFDAITAGASGLVGGWGVALVLTDPGGQDPSVIASRHGRRTQDDAAVRASAAVAMAQGDGIGPDGPGSMGDPCCAGGAGQARGPLIAEPVRVEGEIVGSLVADLPSEPNSTSEWRALLTAFAQQVSLALADARTMKAMREAFHDPLTGLANRALLLEAMEQAIGASHPEAGDITIIYIDLDGFKAVNDSSGHQAGDELLRLVAIRISRCLRSGDMAARVGGDEFVILLEGADQAMGVEVAERIISAIREPFYVADREVFVAASAGVAQRRPPCADAADLLSTGDIAMYQAKQRGRGRVVVFEPTMRATIRERIELQSDLRRAAGFRELSLQYQPIVSLTSGAPVGVEALIRWNHPQRGPVPPGEFISIAEETGVIRDLGSWVLEESTRQVREWRKAFPGLRLNVNVSARQIGFRRFPAEVAEILARTQLPGHSLTLELTETALMLDPDAALLHLEKLREHGVQISVDDFGTGYSSLSYLRKFPVDEVKIDRAFVAYLDRSTDDLALVRAIVELGRSLRLQTVAEGIENDRQLAALRELGCALGQGYLLARPMDPEDVGSYFRRSGWRAADRTEGILNQLAS